MLFRAFGTPKSDLNYVNHVRLNKLTQNDWQSQNKILLTFSESNAYVKSNRYHLIKLPAYVQ